MSKAPLRPDLSEARQAMRIAQEQSQQAMVAASEALQQVFKLLQDARVQMHALSPERLDPLASTRTQSPGDESETRP